MLEVQLHERSSRVKLVATAAAVYIIWSSTYLAIRYAIETLPPYFMAGTRFLIAGTVLYVWARWREAERPRLINWKAATIVGAWLLLGGNGNAVWAEQRGPSGLAALLVVTEPLWVVVSEAQTTRSAAAYYHRGNTGYAEGDLDRAIADFDIAITFDPNWALAYYHRGAARYAKGDLDGAMADLDKTIELNPRFAAAYNNRGVIRYAEGNLDGALSDFDQALKIAPRLTAAYINRGAVLADKWDLDGAIADYNKAIELDPRAALAYANRGLAWLLGG